MKTTRYFSLVGMLVVAALSGFAQTAEVAGAGAPQQVQAAAPASLSPNAAEVLKLASSGVGDDVVLAFVQNSQLRFNLSADDVLYLRDVGVTEPVITAMLNHDNAMSAQEPQSPPTQYAPTATEQAPAPAPAQPAPASQVVAPAPTYVSSPPEDVGYFYNDLAPYGTWVSLAGVGWCWQPTVVVVNRGWRPYLNGGHWVYTDAGWFWQSDYSWGWAPFHYGRWYMDARCGWVWTPGRVWGPAWVTWRTVGTTCGWAPLPPRADFVAGIGWRYNGVSVAASFGFGLGVDAFAFVSFNNFCDNNLSYRCLPPAQVRGIYHQTTVVNNYTVINNTYVNRGIPVERIGAASHRPVPRLALRDTHRGQPKPAGVQGPVAYRTQLGKPESSKRMLAQKVDNTRPRIEHTAYRPTGSEPGHAYGSSRPGSGSGSTPATRVQGERRAPAATRGAAGLMNPSTSTAGKGQQNLAPGSSLTPGTSSGSGKSQGTGNNTYRWQGSDRPADTRRNLPAPGSYPASGSPSGIKASPGAQPTTTSPAHSSGSPTIRRPASSVGSSAQTQPAAAQTTRGAVNPHFYTPKTIEQSNPSRSFSPQSSASARPAVRSDAGNRRSK